MLIFHSGIYFQSKAIKWIGSESFFILTLKPKTLFYSRDRNTEFCEGKPISIIIDIDLIFYHESCLISLVDRWVLMGFYVSGLSLGIMRLCRRWAFNISFLFHSFYWCYLGSFTFLTHKISLKQHFNKNFMTGTVEKKLDSFLYEKSKWTSSY